MIENLLNYGVLGLWTVFLIYDRQTTMKKLTKVIEDNTEAINNLRK